MKYDQHFSARSLEYYPFGNFMIMVFGSKIWKESKITFASCPFQNIRGILLNPIEFNSFQKVQKTLGDLTLFENNEIIVAASHANENAKLNIQANRGLNFGNIGIKVSASNENKVQETIIKNSLTYAKEKAAKILIFPELSINQDNMKYLEEQLAEADTLKLVVAGSYYKLPTTTGQSYTNTAPIYAQKDGKWEVIAEYNKMIPFSMGYTERVAQLYGIDMTTYPLEKYNILVEDIYLDNNVTLLPCKDCVIGVAICRDVMDLLEKHNPLHKYCDFVDVMIVISDNTGDSNMFVGVAECLARWHNCGTLYTNSINEAGKPEVYDSHLEVSFAIYPFKKDGSSSSTSVSGNITYASEPLVSKEVYQLASEQPLGILYSKGIQYSVFDKKELENCCKVYTMSVG